MIRLIVGRVLTTIPTLLIVTIGVFLLVQLVPTDPAVTIAGGPSAAPEDVERVREDLHLNDSLVSQYSRWLGDAVTGDLGTSYVRKTSVNEDLESRLPVTLGLIFAAVGFALVIALPLGLLSGLRPNGALDHGARIFSSAAIAVPSFVLALILVLVFAVELGWLPPSGYEKFSESPLEWLRFITLPAIALGLAITAAISRQLRAALIDELDTNHIRTAWAVGGSSGRVVGRHGLKNAAGPAITILGLQVAALVGGAVLVEQIFSLPGLGSYLLGAITQADIPAIQGTVLVLAVMQIMISLVVDIAYVLLNPRVRAVA